MSGGGAKAKVKGGQAVMVSVRNVYVGDEDGGLRGGTDRGGGGGGQDGDGD